MKWYIQVFEDGKDTREILQQYYTQKKEHKLLKETTGKLITKQTKQIKKLQKDNFEILTQLKKQQKMVVEPMITESVKQVSQI